MLRQRPKNGDSSKKTEELYHQNANKDADAVDTGACAAAVAAVLNGFCKKDEEISVILKGGTLKIRYTDEAVYLTGDAVTVFSGHIVM